MNGGETEGRYCWTADSSDEHKGIEFLGYRFKSITCGYSVP